MATHIPNRGIRSTLPAEPIINNTTTHGLRLGPATPLMLSEPVPSFMDKQCQSIWASRCRSHSTTQQTCVTCITMLAQDLVARDRLNTTPLCRIMSSPELAKEYAAEAIATLNSLCATTKTLNVQDTRDCDKFAECVKIMLRQSAESFVQNAAGAPLLTSKSADGTPLKVVVNHKTTLPSGRVVERGGKTGREFLLKNQFLRYYIAGEAKTCAILQDPICLDHGKSAGAIFAACSQHWRTLRELGHGGIAIEHYCYDRGGIEASERYWRAYHDRAPIPVAVAPLASEKTLRLTEMVIVTPCAAHDVQSSFRWGMGQYLQDRQLLRDVFIGIEALRHSMDLVQRFLVEWVTEKLQFVSPRPASIEPRRLLFASLDIDDETADVMSDQLQLHFSDGRLQVSNEVVGMPDLVDLIKTCLSSTFKFVRFSDSRFLTVGTSCRVLVAGVILGLEDLIEHIRKAPSASLFYLHGFLRLRAEPDRMRFVVEAAFVSRASDGVLAFILEDPRVGRHHDEIWQILCEDMSSILSVPISVWEAVGAVAELSSEQFRAACIRGAHVSFHFMWRRIMDPAGRLPWSLVRGDVAENLEMLGSDPNPPDDPVSLKLWELYRSGFNQVQLQRAIELIGDIGWSTMAVEQQHGTMALIHRHHPDYSKSTLMARTLV